MTILGCFGGTTILGNTQMDMSSILFYIVSEFQRRHWKFQPGIPGGKTSQPFFWITLRTWWQKGIWLVVSTHLKNIGQNRNLPQVGVKMKKCLKPPPRYGCNCTPCIISFEPCVHPAATIGFVFFLEPFHDAKKKYIWSNLTWTARTKYLL